MIDVACINVNDDRFKALARVFNDNIAKGIITRMSNEVPFVNRKRPDPFYYPTIKEVKDWMAKNHQKQIDSVKRILELQPNASIEALAFPLKGVIHLYNGEYYINKLNDRSNIDISYTNGIDNVFYPNLKVMQTLQELFPDRFTIHNIGQNWVTKVTITPPHKKPYTSKLFNDYSIGENNEIAELFESNPELASIGTPQQYSQYLDTIFPDSKVKDIVYRGGNITKEEFENSEHTPTDYMDLGLGLYLSPNIRFAKNYGTPRAVLVNIKNPKDVSIAYQERVDYGRTEGQYGIPQLDSNGRYDGIVDLSKDFKDTYELVVFEPEQIHFLGSKQDIEGFKDFVQGKQFQKLTTEEKVKTIEQVTKEHRSIIALKDLAHKLAHRIGGKIKFENKTDVDWKGYNQGMTSVLNEAYMTPDTPFHEILAHPIIRAIKESDFYKKVNNSYDFIEWVQNNKPEYKPAPFMEGIMSEGILKEAYNKYGKEFEKLYPNKSNTFNSLYQSLLKELETGKGKEVFERVKRDYVKRESYDDYNNIKPLTQAQKDLGIVGKMFERIPEHIYTLEEQQEEAIVTLLGLMAADKLDAKKDASLISKLKELWKQISDFVKSLLKQDGIKIDELPITTTLNDLAEIMAYGNNKIILPGYKVEYSTPLGNKYDTLEEVNNEIRELADADVEVDLSDVKIHESKDIKNVKDIPVNNFSGVDGRLYERQEDGWKLIRDKVENGGIKRYYEKVTDKEILFHYNSKDGWFDGVDFTRGGLEGFIEKNKQYEQAREIIEQWKKENNIQYDPEEVYSRGQGFYSSIGAYSNLELDLLLKNLIQHIQDNKKAGGEFTISAFTKPIDKRLKHIEGTGDRVRFVIYPKSEHIKWAAPTDVHSGSVWDAHEKVSKDKKSELLGVSFTKAPALRNINEVSPNLADIIDNISHSHNELGIELTTNNFRIEYDDDIDYATKKLIDNVNKILDDKYGKLEKASIIPQQQRKRQAFAVIYNGIEQMRKDTLEGAKNFIKLHASKWNRSEDAYSIQDSFFYDGFTGKQPTQTKENTISIESIKDKLDDGTFGIKSLTARLKYEQNKIKILQGNIDTNLNVEESKKAIEETKKEISRLEDLIKNPPQKEYTQQALTNLKVAALKEVTRKYPRSLITSKVVPINPTRVDNSEIQYSKVNSQQNIDNLTLLDSDNIGNISFLTENKIVNLVDSETNKPCLREGGNFNFTTGGKWDILTKFKGASHENGGIDVDISNKGIKLSNKQGIIKAENGLIINKVII